MSTSTTPTPPTGAPSTLARARSRRRSTRPTAIAAPWSRTAGATSGRSPPSGRRPEARAHFPLSPQPAADGPAPCRSLESSRTSALLGHQSEADSNAAGDQRDSGIFGGFVLGPERVDRGCADGPHERSGDGSLAGGEAGNVRVAAAGVAEEDGEDQGQPDAQAQTAESAANVTVRGVDDRGAECEDGSADPQSGDGRPLKVARAEVVAGRQAHH